jgi:cardiolipin synthase
VQPHYELISEGDRYYARALRAIRRARHSVQLMVYIWQDDAVGRLFLRALERKCRQNVHVMVVVDAVGSYKLPSDFFRKLQECGAEVYMHHHFRALNWQWFRFLIRRNHRKIIMVDNEVAFTGGFNIMRECSRRHFGERRWLDLALVSRHAGFIRHLAAQFRDASCRARPPWLRQAAPSMAHCSRARRPWLRQAAPSVAHCSRARHQNWARRQLMRSRNRAILLSRSRAVSYSMSRYLKRRLRQARQQIVISVPYFVPYGFYYRILKRKLKRGISVEIILPESSDVPLVDGVSFYLARKLMQRGAQIYLYHGPGSERRFSHTKFYLIDGFAGTGSANYDYRSMVLNLDTLVFVRAANSQWRSIRTDMKRFSRPASMADLRPGLLTYLLLPFRWLL